MRQTIAVGRGAWPVTLQAIPILPKGVIMNLSDILTLAKQGFKAADIKELIALADTKESKPEGSENENTEKHTEGEKEPEKEVPEENVSSGENDTDYKKLYEETLEKLKKAQSENRRSQDGKTEPKTTEQQILDHFNSILK